MTPLAMSAKLWSGWVGQQADRDLWRQIWGGPLGAWDGDFGIFPVWTRRGRLTRPWWLTSHRSMITSFVLGSGGPGGLSDVATRPGRLMVQTPSMMGSFGTQWRPAPKRSPLMRLFGW